jgi:hypothetical protein
MIPLAYIKKSKKQKSSPMISKKVVKKTTIVRLFLYFPSLKFFASSFSIPANFNIQRKVPSADTLSHQ